MIFRKKLTAKLNQIYKKIIKFWKDLVDEKFLSKIKYAQNDHKPVIKIAAIDATILVTACLLGIITSESDDANYSVTKEKFIDLVIINKNFKDMFEGALNIKNTPVNPIIKNKRTSSCTIC
jgi:hypothetical protein